jgi:hypothetical protein
VECLTVLSRYSSDETMGNYIGFTAFEDSYCDLMGDDFRQSGMHHTDQCRGHYRYINLLTDVWMGKSNTPAPV